MAKKQDWIVRITFPGQFDLESGYASVLDKVPILGSFLECLRYAGHGSIREDNEDVIFDLRCPNPKGLDQQVWAQQNAERMRTFGFITQALPK